MESFEDKIKLHNDLQKFQIEKSIVGSEAYNIEQDLMKGISQEKILENKELGIYKSEDLLKGGKRAVVGEIRTFGGKKYQKQSDGSWRPAKGEKSDKVAKDKKEQSWDEIKTDLQERLGVAVGYSSMAENSLSIYPNLKPNADQYSKNSSHTRISLSTKEGRIGGWSGYDSSELREFAKKEGYEKSNYSGISGIVVYNLPRESKNKLSAPKLKKLTNLLSSSTSSESKRQYDFYRNRKNAD